MLRGLKGALTMALLAALTNDIQVLVRERAVRPQPTEVATALTT